MNDFNYMLERMTRDLAVMLMDRRHLSMADALDTVYNSETYAKLSDQQSGLFFQAPGYVYDFLDKEIEYGKMQ